MNHARQPTPEQIAARELAATQARWAAAGCKPLDPIAAPVRTRTPYVRGPRHRPYIPQSPGKWELERRYNARQCADLYAYGFSVREVSQMTGARRVTVRKYIQESGIQMRPTVNPGPPKWTAYPADVVELVRALYVDEGLSTDAVAARVGFSSNKVKCVLHLHGIPVRGRGGKRRAA